MGFQRSFTGWIGAVTAIFGLAFIQLGIRVTDLVNANRAVGVPMWGGFFLILSGMAIVVEVMGRSKRKAYYSFWKFPIVSLVANLFTFIIVCIIIALLTWAMYDGYLNDTGTDDERVNGLSFYVTIIVMATLLLIVSLFGMFIDCCGAFFVVPTEDFRGHPPAVYDTRPAVIYK